MPIRRKALASRAFGYTSDKEKIKAANLLLQTVAKLRQACENDRIKFSYDSEDAKGNDVYVWSKWSLTWKIIVSDTGYISTLSFHDKRIPLADSTLFVHEADYLVPIDRTTTTYKMPLPTNPFEAYVKAQFNFDANMERFGLARLRKQRSQWQSASPTFRVTSDTPFSISGKEAVPVASVHALKVVPKDSIRELVSEFQQRSERLQTLLDNEERVLSWEQEHLFENLLSDYELLMGQYNVDSYVDKREVTRMVDEGLTELLAKMETLEQAAAHQQKRNIERILLLIKERT